MLLVFCDVIYPDFDVCLSCTISSIQQHALTLARSFITITFYTLSHFPTARSVGICHFDSTTPTTRNLAPRSTSSPSPSVRSPRNPPHMVRHTHPQRFRPRQAVTGALLPPARLRPRIVKILRGVRAASQGAGPFVQTVFPDFGSRACSLIGEGDEDYEGECFQKDVGAY